MVGEQVGEVRNVTVLEVLVVREERIPVDGRTPVECGSRWSGAEESEEKRRRMVKWTEMKEVKEANNEEGRTE
jgi:hypothetical protein